ncbi:polymer-forming cytoskeletal protein [Patescibacteria group bacterium]|nr:polymer-forming cytoskeletal protein [Patescibacteria group bacterium]
MKTHIFLALVILTVALSPFSVDAAYFKAGESVTVPKDEVISENAYIAGGQVTVSTSVLRDVIIAGGKVILNGQIWGDALLAGGSVDVLELVQGDVRAAGGQVTLAHVVNGDALLAGGAVSVLPGAQVAGDAVLAGDHVVMDGIITGTTRIYGRTATINGTVKGPLYVNVQESLSFGPKAIIEKSVIYKAPEEAVIAEGAKMPEDLAFTATALPKKEMKENVAKALFAIVSVLFIIKFLAMALAVVFTVSFFNSFGKKVAVETLDRFWHMVFVGFIATVVAPVLIVTLLLSVVGMYVGFLVGTLYLLAVLAAGVLMCVTAGALISKLAKKEIIVNWKWGLLGTIAVFAASFIPLLGWIAVLFLYFASLGAALTSLYRDAKAKMS